MKEKVREVRGGIAGLREKPSKGVREMLYYQEYGGGYFRLAGDALYLRVIAHALVAILEELERRAHE